MRTILFAAALLAGTAALAQDDTITPPPVLPETTVPAAPDAQAGISDAMTPTVATAPALPSTGSVQAPGNTNPKRDARGIAVISDPAFVPAGYNGTAATGVGGPLTDSADAAATTDASHPPCTAEVTDNCLQTYERGRSPE
ncbi:hypothetical protein [Sphingosinicella sp.]|uniref:hypothetical protein n=1 Tax=Sphingosinicella sp. TaxID=1917971 RepID=UPI0040384DDE